MLRILIKSGSIKDSSLDFCSLNADCYIIYSIKDAAMRVWVRHPLVGNPYNMREIKKATLNHSANRTLLTARINNIRIHYYSAATNMPLHELINLEKGMIESNFYTMFNEEGKPIQP